MIPPRLRARSAALATLPVLLAAACGPPRVERPEVDAGRAWSLLISQVSAGLRHAGHGAVVEQRGTVTLDGSPRELANLLARFDPAKAELVYSENRSLP